MYINLHPDERIDERYGIRPRIFYSESHLRDAGHVRRQLGDDGMRALRADRTHDLCRRTRVRAKDNPSFPDIRTGNIDFKRRHTRNVQTISNLRILLNRTSGDIDNNVHSIVLNTRQSLVGEDLYPWILETDAVKHSLWSLCNPHTVIAAPWSERCPFNHHAAKA